MSIERLTAALSDRYAIERELGAGGMATVYLAHDAKHDRQVAIKVLRSELSAVIGAERFLREIRTIASLQHPHILGLLDSGEAGGFLYYVMPYVDGESLRARLGRGRLPIDDALRILAEIADALDCAHEHGVVHRDIKPDNVMLSGRHALVMDFGVAKAVSEAGRGQDLTETGMRVGTLAYMAPEQALADPNLDHRVDIYALGIIGYEMLAGPPFQGSTPQELVAAQLTRAPKPLSAARPAVPAALDAIIMKCLEKRPADRWQSAEQVRSELELLRATSSHVTPVSPRPSVPERSGPALRPWLVGALGGALVAAAAWAVSLRQSQPAALVLGRRMAVATAPEWEIHPSLSPNGQMLSFTSIGRAPPRLIVQEINGGNPVVVSQVGFGGVFSPDGARLLALTPRGLEAMPMLGGQSTVISTTAKWGSWSPDGRAVVYPSGDTLFIQVLDSVRVTPIATGRDLHSPAWSSDGRWIAYVEGNSVFHRNGNLAASGIRVVPRGGGVSVLVARNGALNTSPAWLPGKQVLLFISDREGGRDIYQVGLATNGVPRGDPVRLTTGLDAEWISVSADGRRLAWSQFRETSNIWSLAIPVRDSVPFSRSEQVTSGTQNIENLGVSRDGEWLYFDSERAGNSDIYRRRLSGGPEERLTTDPAADFDPAPSPDGQDVAFHSLRTGNRDIFVMASTGGEVTQVTRSPEQDYNPTWSRDGRQLVFDRQQTQDQGLWVTERRAATTWGEPTPLPLRGRAARPRWSPDGRWISFVAPDGVRVFEVSTRRTHLLFSSSDEVFPATWTAWSEDSRVVYLTRSDSLGVFRITGIPLDGSPPRTVAFADFPARQVHRHGIAVFRNKIFFPLIDRNSDVWVAEILSAN